MKLLLVDGSNLLFQMFYGMPARIPGPDGRPIHGTLGFVGALLKILRMIQPTHTGVFFDGEYVSARAELDHNYKSNRTDYSTMPSEETPFSQLPDIYAALDCLGLCHAETTLCEVDDWIAGYARQWPDELVIASQDSDLFQLITPQTSVLRYRGKRSVLCDPPYIRQRYGIEPSQYADFKALVGDPSDHIPGVPKIGPKTAASLLNTYGTLDGILSRTNEISRPSLRDAILQAEPRLRTNQALIYLDGTAELPFSFDRLCCASPELTTSQVLSAIGLR